MTFFVFVEVLSILIYCGHCGEDDERPIAVLTLQPNWKQIFIGETVTMRCDIQGGGDSDWQYEWHNNTKSVYSNKKPEYRISPVYTANSGSYTCQGVKGIKRSETSDAVQLTVSALPSATLSVSPQGPLYSGDTVTLQCDIPDYTDWTYYWYRNNQPFSSTHGKTITISLPDQDGQYQCAGTRTDRPQKSQLSRALSIQFIALPTASMSISPQGLLYSRETVTLQCVIPGYTDWMYYWYRNNQQFSSQTSETITISLPDQAGQYQCQGKRTRRPQWSNLSSSLPIIVTALPETTLSVEPNPVFPGETVTLTCSVGSDSSWSYKCSAHDLNYQPSTTLTSDKENIFTGDSVTLSCTVESPGWTFYWYRHRPDSTPVTTTSGYSYTLSWVSVSDGGQYWCRAGRGDPVYYTLYSDSVQINITEKPVAFLTLQPNWTQIFIRETVTMRCDIQGGGDSDWNYRWYKNSQLFSPFNTKTEYRISPVYMSNSGLYTCEGVKGNKISKTSDAVQLTVSGKPKAVLSISPQWLNPGDSVTLSCEVDKTSTGWRFSWYRTVPYRAGLPSLSDKSYSLQPLSDNVTSEDSYTLIPAGPTPTGGYVCRAGRGDPVYDTLYSEPQFLWSGDLQPSVSLRISPNTTQQFKSKSLSLSCEEKGNSTGWRLMRNTERGVESVCVSNWESITGSTCTISYTFTRDSGVYWCEYGSGEYSNAVNITVPAGDVILESPVHPVTEGDSVTLRCKYWTTSSNIKADFYKDGVLIKNGTTGEMTIPAVSKSDEGFYKCKYPDKGESPESWMTVRVVSPGSSTSVLEGVVVGLVVAGVLLVIILVLLCRFKNSKGTPRPREPTRTPNRTKDLPRVRLLMLGGAHIYDTINPSDNNVNGTV
ncbi:basement membrane-specific heparan sulfate proteoglycan core protein-like [Salvelinus namaycush]|uniref:Basement membrane-specific heparan sulfate proteoglycan core protein-like n=1 Tax=Salvelinus namaycush TaxID=8040 RepID=A0A8U0TXI2_SALNM|nr:basement membrane-specific heparan sulfate proteoglycan core protein-like [Salvelinus namaycush]